MRAATGSLAIAAAAFASAAAASLAACAADPGDPSKLTASASTTGPSPEGSSIVPEEDASPITEVDSTVPPTEASTSTTSPEAGSEPAEDSSAEAEVDGSSSSPEAGAGCSSGATVITVSYTNANSGNFNTTGPVCVELLGSVKQGWGLSNEAGRMLTLTSAAGAMGPIDATQYTTLTQTPQAGSDGYVYWNFTAETNPMDNYTSLYIF
jgi:hypothetical protein